MNTQARKITTGTRLITGGPKSKTHFSELFGGKPQPACRQGGRPVEWQYVEGTRPTCERCQQGRVSPYE